VALFDDPRLVGKEYIRSVSQQSAAVPSSLCHGFCGPFLPQSFMMPSDITRWYHEAAMGQILVRNIEDMTFKIEVHFGCVMPPR